MRRLIVAAGSLVVFGAGWCLGQSHHGNDGNSWHNLPPLARTFYVQGFSQGYASAVMQTGVLTMSKNAPEKVPSMNPSERKDYEEILGWAKRIVPFEVAGPPKSVGDLERTLDTFYSDYRNTPVCLEKAILFSIASLAGNAATDQELDAVRKKDAKSGCQ